MKRYKESLVRYYNTCFCCRKKLYGWLYKLKGMCKSCIGYSISIIKRNNTSCFFCKKAETDKIHIPFIKSGKKHLVCLCGKRCNKMSKKNK